VHVARHTAATLFQDQSVASAVVQEMLGHSDIRVTRGYSHVTSPLTQGAAQRMGRALFGTATQKNNLASPRRRLELSTDSALLPSLVEELQELIRCHGQVR
jgi:hypothetical protein